MGKRSFTLTEVVIATIIISILATLGYPIYYNTKNTSSDKVEATRLRALKSAFEIYLMENDKVPAAITEIPYENIQKAYASILKGPGGWKIKLAEFFLKVSEEKYACAETSFLLEKMARGDLSLLCCAGIQGCTTATLCHGINLILADKDAAYYRDTMSATDVVFGTSGGYPTFSGTPYSYTYRHLEIGTYGYYYGIGIQRSGAVYRYSGGVPKSEIK